MRDKFCLWVAWKMPRWLVYRCAIRLGSEVTTGIYGATEVPALSFMDALKRWANHPSFTKRIACRYLGHAMRPRQPNELIATYQQLKKLVLVECTRCGKLLERSRS